MTLKQAYHPLRDQDADEEEKSEQLLNSNNASSVQGARQPPSRNWSRRYYLLVLSNLLFAFSTGLLAAFLIFRSPHDPTWATDFPSARHLVRYEQRLFSGVLTWNETAQTVERRIDPSKPQYFGEPSEAIDRAWKELLHGEFLFMTDEESKPFEPSLRPFKLDKKRHFELQVTHNLHCLNAIRMSLDKDHYGDHHKYGRLKELAPHFERDHIDHCLHLLFESVQCSSDLTPAPLYTWPNAPLALGRGSMHTCRDFQAVRQWYDERIADGSALDPM